MRELVEERASLVRTLGGGARPAMRQAADRSREINTSSIAAPADTRAFVEAIT